VFAPAAAALCNGVDLGELGEEIDADLLMPGIVPLPREEAGVLLCEVLWVDRFGNCQLNVGPDDLAGWGSIVSVRLGEPTDPVRRVAHIVDHFDAIDPGAPGLVVDAHGMLALALARRSAAEELGLATGELVVLAPLGDDDAPGVTTPVTLRPSS
jgi:S-adenosylmethionine hydrolase